MRNTSKFSVPSFAFGVCLGALLGILTMSMFAGRSIRSGQSSSASHAAEQITVPTSWIAATSPGPESLHAAAATTVPLPMVSQPQPPTGWQRKEFNGLPNYLVPLGMPISGTNRRDPFLGEFPLGCTDVWDAERMQHDLTPDL